MKAIIIYITPEGNSAENLQPGQIVVVREVFSDIYGTKEEAGDLGLTLDVDSGTYYSETILKG